MSILFPAFAMFALTLFVLFRLAALRFAAVRQGQIDPRFFKTFDGAGEPEKLRANSRNLVNLYESPTLFYVIVIIGFVSGQSGPLPVLLAWLYVASRCAHSYVHLGSNKVLLRFRLFLASTIVLITLWIIVFTGIVLAGMP